jgi:5-(carboxyamino)imidazole ribonucleotide synthase
LPKIINLGIIGPEKGPGQLGMLLAMEANKLHCNGEAHLKILTVSTDQAPDWTDENFHSNEEDLKIFFEQAQLITYETESISSKFQEAFARKLSPSKEALQIFQNRLREKNFFKDLGLETPAFYEVNHKTNFEDLENNLNQKNLQSVRLKTCELGYDGLGQKRINNFNSLQTAWTELGQTACILEEEVALERELSVILTRFNDGHIIYYPIPENIHHNGVLYRSRTSSISKQQETILQSTAEKIVNSLKYVGTFALELFQSQDSNFLLNEAAPRVHNSGHYTLDFCEGTNQFDSHLRAICGLEAVAVKAQANYFSMTNLLGLTFQQFQWILEELNSAFQSGKTEVKICPYWYNKNETRKGRKMGHITVTSHSLADLEKAEALIDQLISAYKN